MSDATAVQEQTSHRFYEHLLDNLYEAVWFINPQRQITYWNPGAEQLTGYRRDQIIGKSCCEDLLLHFREDHSGVASGSHPAAETLADGKLRQEDVYLRHREGHLVPVHVRVAPIPDEEGNIAGVIEVLTSNCPRGAEVLTTDQLQDVGLVDPLTGLSNRRYLQMRLQSRYEELTRYNWLFGVILAGIDNYDEASQIQGWETCEKLVQMAGKTFANSLRSYDVVGRWSESEFLAIVPILQYSDLYAVGERVRNLVEKACLMTTDGAMGVTISIGAAAADPYGSVDDLINRAQLWVNRSRTAGGNQVTL
ncbi:MAG TPA: sensor domain-containing diguanylate cyclase [Phycisphaerae bacterium]|nr:sensor domain-containing diguanylate cyclase [Phycisphaerae bacterium]